MDMGKYARNRRSTEYVGSCLGFIAYKEYLRIFEDF